jgi:hypothetical protein
MATLARGNQQNIFPSQMLDTLCVVVQAAALNVAECSDQQIGTDLHRCAQAGTSSRQLQRFSQTLQMNLRCLIAPATDQDSLL